MSEPTLSQEQVQNLRAFAQAILGGWPDVGGLDGFDLQLLGVQHGLLREEIRHKPCGEGCNCATDMLEGDWKAGVQCYRKTDLLKGEPATHKESAES